MPIASYIVYPSEGKENKLSDRLNKLSNLEIHHDDSKRLFIIVTETQNHEDQKKLQENLKEMDEVECLTLAFAGDPNLIEEETKISV